MHFIVAGSVGFAQTPTQTPMSEAHKDLPTCYPLSAAVSSQVLYGYVHDVAVFVEEESWCASGGRPTVPGPVVPRELVEGRGRLDFVVDTLARQQGATQYLLTDRGSVWLVAPTGRPMLADVVVDLDPKTCTTVDEAERCLFDQVAREAMVWIGPNADALTTRFLVNDVALSDVPLVDALRAIWAPHERTPVGYVFNIAAEVAPNGMRGASYYNIFEFDLSGPEMEVAPIIPFPDSLPKR